MKKSGGTNKIAPRKTKTEISLADVTHRNNNSAWLRSILESAMDAIISIDESQRIILFNRAAEKMFLYSQEEIIGKSVNVLIPKRFRVDHKKHVKVFGDKGTTTRTMGRLGTIYGRRSNGEEFPLEASISNFKTDNRIYFTVILRDITERKLAEEQIKSFEHTIMSINESITLLDLNGKILFVNRAFNSTFGYTNEEIIGKDVKILLSSNNSETVTRGIFRDTFDGGWEGELIKLKKDGTEFPVYLSTSLLKDDAGKPRAMIGVSHDLTKQKFLEDQLIQHQKMQSINMLVKGIAHHFNNILAVILGYASISSSDDITKETLERNLKIIVDAVDRGVRLVKQMYTFSQPGALKFDHLEINSLIQSTVQIASETFSERFTFSFSLAKNLPKIFADQTSIRQVIVNILHNAKDAMPDGGNISISTKIIKDKLSFEKAGFQTRHKRYVAIAISDNGIGMSKETKNHAFDPFFTTKDIDKGIGLGLTVAYSIMQIHQGFIDIDSSVGSGTTVYLYLPVTARVKKTSA